MKSFFELRARMKAYKNRKLKPFVYWLKSKWYLSSNILSLLGLICGLIAAFYLFDNHKIFGIFIIFHILFDILDGALAKVEGKKDEGWIVDVGIDRLVTTAILLKTLFYGQIFPAGPVLGIFLLINLFLIYERLVLKRRLSMLHIDPFTHILFIMQLFGLALWILLASYVINFINLMLQVSRHKSKVEAESTWANLVSLLRPFLIIYGLVKFEDRPLILAIWIIAVILLDAVDGIIARRLKEKSRFGSYIDIAADRAVELIILFTYASWGLIHYIFPLIFTIRGLVTDFLRILNNIYKDEKFKEPLSIGKADDRFTRGLYGFVKLAAFAVILLFYNTGYILMVIALILNLYRGLPVIFSRRSKVLVKKFLC